MNKPETFGQYHRHVGHDEKKRVRKSKAFGKIFSRLDRSDHDMFCHKFIGKTNVWIYLFFQNQNKKYLNQKKIFLAKTVLGFKIM